MYYMGLDVNKKTISYYAKGGSGQIHTQGAIPATRFDLSSISDHEQMAGVLRVDLSV